MGAELYWYYVKYQPDLGAALRELREQGIRGRALQSVIPFQSFRRAQTHPPQVPSTRQSKRP